MWKNERYRKILRSEEVVLATFELNKIDLKIWFLTSFCIKISTFYIRFSFNPIPF